MSIWKRKQKPATAAKDGPYEGDLQDPYARWAAATEWRAYQRSPGYGWRDAGSDEVRIIARAPDGPTMQRALTETNPLVIPGFYRDDPSLAGSLYFTAKLKREQLSWLRENPLKLTWELATPLREAMWTAQSDSRGRFGPEREELALNPTSDLPREPPRQRDEDADPVPQVGRHSIKEPTLAVIDYGCPFLNPQFADAGNTRTRIAALWDQQSGPMARDAGRKWWRTPDAAGYGRELSGMSIEALRTALPQSSRPLDEATLYQGLGYLVSPNDARRRIYNATHGAHVMDLAAGHPDPLWRLHPGGGPADPDTPDAAGAAPLVFVQLPALTAADSSGASLGAQVLDALRYILYVCAPDQTVVVNISYGSFAGPHDGTSLIELAIAELLRLRGDRLRVVLAAGNARQADCHARRVVSKDRSALLRLLVQPNDTTATFMELWYPPHATAELQMRARTAGRAWSDWVLPGEHTTLCEPATRELLAMLQHDKPQAVAEGEAPRKALTLLSLAATESAVNDEGPLNEAGAWELEVALKKDASGAQPDVDVPFDAWIERDDASDRGLGGQPCFLGLDRSDETNTLSSLALAQGAVIVGAFCLSSREPAAYASLPDPVATRTPLLVWAASDESPERPGLLATAVRTGETFRMGGTSAAAPVLARRLFNRIRAGGLPTKDGQDGIDWPAVLQQLAQSDEGFVLLPASPPAP